jgi:hypothetical protein
MWMLLPAIYSSYETAGVVRRQQGFNTAQKGTELHGLWDYTQRCMGWMWKESGGKVGPAMLHV